ncbi:MULTISPECIES: hypothetical protein [Methylobacter]
MIAVRMYVTGHCQSEIEFVVRQCAPTIRTPEQAEKHHNWDDYAQRTARYAFSAMLKPLESTGCNGRSWKGARLRSKT